MKTATDLREIKKLARMFVMLDIQNTEYSPLIVKHPFTDSGMVAYRTEDGGIAQADITSDPAALELWQQEKFRQIKEARTPHEISILNFNTSQRLSPKVQALLFCVRVCCQVQQ